MRRFILGWRVLGLPGAMRTSSTMPTILWFLAETVSKCGRRSITDEAVETRSTKTRCCRVPEEPVEFLAIELDATTAAIEPISAHVRVRQAFEHLPQDKRVDGEAIRPAGPGVVVGRINRSMTGWANYFCLGQVSPDAASRQWLCRKHKVRFGSCAVPGRESMEGIRAHHPPRTVSFPGRRHDLVREPCAPHARFDLET